MPEPQAGSAHLGLAQIPETMSGRVVADSETVISYGRGER
jgi:hypothetical protein